MSRPALTSIKRYFSERIKEVNKGFKEHPFPFDEADIGKTLSDKSFQIIPGALQNGTARHTSNLGIKVKLFFDSGRDSQATFWDGYGMALSFKNKCLKAENAGNEESMAGILLNGISEPQPVSQNGRAVVFEINFTVIGVFNVDAEEEL